MKWVPQVPWELIPLGAQIKEKLLKSGQMDALRVEVPKGSLNRRLIAQWRPLLTTFPLPGWVWLHLGPRKWVVNYSTQEATRCLAHDVVNTNVGLICLPNKGACGDLPEQIVEALAPVAK